MIKRGEKIGIILLIMFPVIVHLILLNKHSLNVPFKDDYRVFMSYLYYFFNAPDKFKAVLLPDNESYPVIMRLITLTQYSLDRALNFRHILFFCNLFLLLFFLSLTGHFIKKKEYWAIAFMSLLVLNVMHHEMYFRTDVGTYQLVSFSFSIFLFYAATNYNTVSKFTRFMFYVAFIVTPLGSINGMVANALIALYFLLNHSNKKLAWFTNIVFIIQVVGISFIGSNNSPSESLFSNIQKYGSELFYAYFLALGGIFNLINHPTLWMAIAILSFIIFIYTFYKLFFPFELKLDFEKLVFLFCTGSLALIVLLRYNYWLKGYESILESRYKIYGALVICLFFLVLFREYSRNILVKVAIPSFLTLLFLAGLYKGKQMLNLQNVDQMTEAYNVQEGGFNATYAELFYVNEMKKNTLEHNSIYSFHKVKSIIDSLLSDHNKITQYAKTAQFIDKPGELDNLGEWESPLIDFQTFKATGNFPVRKFYFIKFAGENNKSCVQFLNPPPLSIIKKVLNEDRKEIESLNRIIPTSSFDDIDFTDFEIYGVDDLGL